MLWPASRDTSLEYPQSILGRQRKYIFLKKFWLSLWLVKPAKNPKNICHLYTHGFEPLFPAEQITRSKINVSLPPSGDIVFHLLHGCHIVFNMGCGGDIVSNFLPGGHIVFNMGCVGDIVFNLAWCGNNLFELTRGGDIVFDFIYGLDIIFN